VDCLAATFDVCARAGGADRPAARRGCVGALSALLWLLSAAPGAGLAADIGAGADAAGAVSGGVLDLQPLRQQQRLALYGAEGASGSVTLVDLNLRAERWFVLIVRPPSASGVTRSYHLEFDGNPQAMRAAGRASLQVDEGTGTVTLLNDTARCQLWSSHENALQAAAATGLPYAPLCADGWYVRNRVAGTYTPIERVSQFLRDHVWQGDRIVNFVREQAFQDAYSQRAVLRAQPPATPLSAALGPTPASVRGPDRALTVDALHLGIDLGVAVNQLAVGGWYAVRDAPGIYVSVMRPASISASILAGDARHVNRLDPIESDALDYLVGLDLAQFELHFAVGTDEPRVGWSERALPQWQALKRYGPDGFDSLAPLNGNGMVAPAIVPWVAATFAGGFKREHGAFRYGALAQRDLGSHYGFMQQGVILSSLQPGLATLYSRLDGTVGMRTWTAADNATLLAQLLDARQNGVPLIEYDATRGVSAPGALVNQWGAGNWSGSSEQHLRTVRAGVCQQFAPNGRVFLLFGYFSTATPSAMARVFRAYACRYAMQLDINALEHTYFALYTRQGGRVEVQHLIDGMAVVDRKGGGALAPRFLGFPDDRDFFYLVRRRR